MKNSNNPKFNEYKGKIAEIAMKYHDSISRIVGADIKTLIAKRGRDSKRYYKSKENMIVTSNGTLFEKTSADINDTTTHITKEENNNKYYIKSKSEKNTEFKRIPIPFIN